MNNNMAKNVNSELIQYKISLLINAILYTGYTTKNLNRTIIIPIIKDKNKKNSTQIITDRYQSQT
jgi:hypothetical protein